MERQSDWLQITQELQGVKEKIMRYSKETPTSLSKKIFAPEHGFFGEASAGVKVDYDSTNNKRIGTEIISLYGKDRKPTTDMMKVWMSLSTISKM